MFSTNSIFIGIYDEQNSLINFPYSVEEGVRDEMGAIPMGEGLTSQIIRTQRPLRNLPDRIKASGPHWEDD